MGNSKIKNRLILESSFPGTLYLLFEDTSEVDEAQEFSRSAIKAIQVRLKKINSLIGSLPSGGYRSGLENLVNKSVGDKVKSLIEKTKNLTDPSENLKNAAKEAGVLASEIDKASKDISTTIKINLALMRYMASQILKSELHKGENKDIPMEEILKEGDLLETALKELGQAFDTAFKSIPNSKTKKGFFAKLGDALFGSKSEEPVAEQLKDNKDDLVKSILELTPIEIAKFTQSIVNYGKEDDKEAKKIKDEANEVVEEVEDEAGGDDASSEDDSKDKGASISRKDLLSKAKEAAGDAGELVVTRLLKSDFFKDFNITESLRNRTLRILVEKDMSAEDYNALIAAVMEENEDAFKDVDTNSMAKDLNKIFLDNEIDFKIEEKPLTWNDLDDKGKRRSRLSFYLDGEYISGGSPSESTFEQLLFSSERAGYEVEDIKDLEVDVNNTLIDQNGKGAPKLVDIPDFVKLVNKLADANDDYKKFKLEDEEGKEEEEEEEGKEEEEEEEGEEEKDANLQAIKDGTGDYYLVPIENQDRLKKAGFDLEEAVNLARLRRLAGIL